VELLRRYRMLDIGEAVKSEAEGLIMNYSVLPNDVVIAATCKHHGIKKILHPLGIFAITLGTPNGHQLGVFLKEITTRLATEIYFVLVLQFSLLGHSFFTSS
jgi:hypothetical protein